MNTATKIALVTETTCGYPCWMAREDVCRCYCGGVNHGCLRDESGVQPARMSKIKGHMYRLINVGRYPEIARQADDLAREMRAKRLVHVEEYHPGYFSIGLPDDAGYPVKHRVASASEEAKWPECAPFRNRALYDWQGRPNLLWVRDDLADQVTL